MRQTTASLSKMNKAAKGRALDKLVRAAQSGKPNGGLSSVEAEIRAFETRYEMTSDEMRKRFRDGTLNDTADVARWLLLLSARDRAAR